MAKISTYTPAAAINDTDKFIGEVVSPNNTLSYTWSLIKSTLKTYFDTLYQGLGVPIDPASSTKTGSYTILDSDNNVFILSGASANSTFTLPTLADNLDREITLFNNDLTYELNVDGEGAETIDGMTDIDLPKQGNYLKLKALSGGWIVVDEAITSELILDTYAGYGSTDTRIMQFTNSVSDVGNMITHNHGSYGTAGLEVTIQREGLYSICNRIAPSALMNSGLSLNSSQLTTNIGSITYTDILSNWYHSGTGIFFSNLPITKRFNKNDVVRVHTDASAPADNSGYWFYIEYIGQ